MKILRLKFKNINSFYGEHPCIDFAANPLSVSGLFIITGPTGAGKSTLLDAITLALYNEIPRFGNVSKTDIEKWGSVVNLKAASEPKTEAYAEVEYEVGSGVYRSKWSISQNRNGKWNNYNMEIADVATGNLLDIKGLQNFPKKNEELIGLSYEQFVKSIILAQGSFAEFLKAKAHDRSKLLEDITGQHLYRQLGQAAYEKDKHLKEQLEAKQEATKLVTLLSDEQINDLQTTQKLTENEKNESEIALKYWQYEANLLNQCLGIQEKVDKNNIEKQRIETQQDSFKTHEDNLTKHESVQEWAGQLATLNAKNEQHQLLQKNIQSLKNQIDNTKKTLSESLIKGGELIGKNCTTDTLSDELAMFENEITELDNQIDKTNGEIRIVFGATKQKIEQAADVWFRGLAVADVEENIERLTQKQQEIAPEFNSFAADYAAESEIVTLIDQEKTLIALISKIEKQNKLATQGKKIADEQKINEGVFENKKPQQEKLLKEIEYNNLKIKELQTKKEREQQKFSFEELRQALREGEDCPLCGATHHPYVHAYMNVLSQVQIELDIIEKAQKTLQKEDEKLSKEITQADTLIQNSKKEILNLREEYKTAKEDTQATLIVLNLPNDTTIEQLHTQQQELLKLRTKLNNWLKIKVLHNDLTQIKADYEDLLVFKNKKTATVSQKQKKYAGKDIKEDVRKLQTTLNNALTTLELTQKQLADNTQKATEAQKEIEKLSATLTHELQQKQIENIEKAQSYLLPTNEYESLKNTRKELNDKTVRVNENEKLLTQQLLETHQKRSQPETTPDDLRLNTKKYDELTQSHLNKTAEITAQLNNDAEQRNRSATLYEELATLKQQRIRWELLNRYIGDSTGNKFSNFAQNLTLTNLIGLANQRLRHLSDRYLIDKPQNDSESLFVVDTYQGNSLRAVNTLSGGETFTMSLALALALSDLASQNVKIESLFIDEGFGTLDPEALDLALTMLERLQTENQKTIGIISHVEALKERIGTQIRLFKSVNGLSTVEVVG